MIKIVVVDDHRLMREALVFMLECEDEFEVIGESGSGLDAIKIIEELRPDIVLMDIKMEDVSGIEVTARLCKKIPGVKIIIVSMLINAQYVLAAIRAGAKGYVVKTAAKKDLILAIHSVYRGEQFLSDEIV